MIRGTVQQLLDIHHVRVDPGPLRVHGHLDPDHRDHAPPRHLQSLLPLYSQEDSGRRGESRNMRLQGNSEIDYIVFINSEDIVHYVSPCTTTMQ